MIEIEGGNPATETVAQTTVTDPETQTESPKTEQVTETPIPERYRGKGPADFVKILEDKEREVGRLGQELGDLRQRSQTYEQMFAQFQMAQQQAQTAQVPHPQVPDEPAKFNWEDPDTSVDRRVERKLKAELDSLRRQMVMETAASQAPIAKNMAKTMYPDAFRGVTDDELDRAMYGGAAAGNVQPQNLTKPEAWRMLGWILQGEKSNYKMPTPGITPVDATATETPRGTKPQNYGEEPIAIDDEARSIIKGFGADEATVLKSMREERRGR